jgi:hypothetical protein
MASILSTDDTTGLPPEKTLAALQAPVNVASYGTLVEGTDVTSVFTAATAAARSLRRPLVVPPGRHTVARWDPKDASVYFSPGAVLVQKSDTEEVLLYSSSETAVGNVAADIPLGATTISYTSLAAGSLVPGDIISIANTVIADPNSSGSYSGELVEVLSVSGTTVTLKSRVQGSYTASKAYAVADGTRARKCNMVRGGKMVDAVFEGRETATVPLVHSYYARDYHFVRPRILKGGDNGICLKMFWNVIIDHPIIENLTDNLVAGSPDESQLGYGVHASNAGKGLQVVSPIFRNLRHGFTTSGGTSGIPRDIVISNPIVSGCNTGAGIDTHAAGDNILIIGGVITSCAIGITLRSKNTHVIGTLIRQCIEGVRWAETVSETTSLRDVTILDVSYGLSLSGPVKNIDIAGLVIRGAIQGVRVTAAVTELKLKGFTIGDCQAEGMTILGTSLDVLISGGSFEDCSMVTATQSLNVSGTAAETVSRFDVVGVTFRQRKSSQASRAINSARKLTAVDNRTFGTFTSSTKFNLAAGSVAANNLEYA